MTRMLSIDPGGNTGIALGYYDATTPYQLLQRWQVHGGVRGFTQWVVTNPDETSHIDELVVEKFILSEDNEFAADITPLLIEGAIEALIETGYLSPALHVIWQPRTKKGDLTGYPPEAVTKDQRQRVRFDFLERFGLFKAGTENDDSNDAITHALVSLKLRKHLPTMRLYWPPRRRLAVVE